MSFVVRVPAGEGRLRRSWRPDAPALSVGGGSRLPSRREHCPDGLAGVELGRRTSDEAFVERAEEATGNTGALWKAARHEVALVGCG